ncbi:hypothetical protein Taro_046581 [Colocasia esculenta]|uniref:UspA domain-containing protein n=1 Tax=Colocasia esculenta TaxID=4460 RepID=A0A843X6B4_COLES|nr:hypothetical protein [Colocasia esculenta]
MVVRPEEKEADPCIKSNASRPKLTDKVLDSVTDLQKNTLKTFVWMKHRTEEKTMCNKVKATGYGKLSVYILDYGTPTQNYEPKDEGSQISTESSDPDRDHDLSSTTPRRRASAPSNWASPIGGFPAAEAGGQSRQESLRCPLYELATASNVSPSPKVSDKLFVVCHLHLHSHPCACPHALEGAAGAVYIITGRGKRPRAGNIYFYFRCVPVMATEATTAGAGAGTTAEKPVMVVALDESENNHHALEWTLQHFFADVERCSLLFSLLVVHAKPPTSSVIGAASPGVAEVWVEPEGDRRRRRLEGQESLQHPSGSDEELEESDGAGQE